MDDGKPPKPSRYAVHLTANAKLPRSDQPPLLLLWLLSEIRSTALSMSFRHTPSEDEAEKKKVARVQSDWTWEEGGRTWESALWTGWV